MGKISTSFFIYLLLHFSVFAELPNVFSPGEIVSSSKVNENFKYLDNRTNENFYGSILYFTALKHDGNLGGRIGADSLCKTDPVNFFLKRLKSNCEQRAILSISTEDEIRDMVNKYGIKVDTTLIDISGHFSDSGLEGLFDQNKFPFDGTSDMLVRIDQFWSGSYSGGVIEDTFKVKKNCNGFTDNSSNVDGMVGHIGTGQPTGIFENSGISCNSKYRIMCLCY